MSPRWLGTLALGVVVATSLALVLGGPATPPTGGHEATIQWNAPASCPGASPGVAAVERYVGRSLGVEVVSAHVTIDGGGSAPYRLQLVIKREGDSDVRILRDDKCEVLADAAAVMIAMAIDPSATVAVMATDPEPVAAVPSPPADSASSGETPAKVDPAVEPKPTEPDTSRPVPLRRAARPADTNDSTSESRDELRQKRCSAGPSRLGTPGGVAPWCVALAVSLPLQLGPLPRFGPGLSGKAGLLWPRLRLDLGGSYFFTQPERASDGRGGDLRLGVGFARVCARLGTRRLEFPLCGGVEAGVMHGEGVGFGTNGRDRVGWSGALADAGLWWTPVGWIALGAQAGAIVPFAQYRFRAGDTVVHTAAPLGFRLGVGVEARFP